MNTIILPGFSVSNKEWAGEIQKKLGCEFPTSVVFWSHWETGKTETGWIEKEAEKIINSFKDKQVNIIAKSIGTIVTMAVLKLKPGLVNKLILCGIPIRDFNSGDEKYYDILREFPTEKLMCIQNKDDNHGSFQVVMQMLHPINLKINIVSMPRADHEYPYPDEFIRFINS